MTDIIEQTPGEQIARNRKTWDRWADLNAESEFYDTAGFKDGRSSLDRLERAGVGDVEGKRLLHLQCHFGQDTLSWARLGAQVVGIDFSERAIDIARELAQELDLPARFVCCDVYDAAECLDEAQSFDIVFVSYGAISWLPDLEPWAKVIEHFLKPEGKVFVIDHHPSVWIFDDTTPEPGLRYKYPYFSNEPIREEEKGNYAQPDAKDVTVTYSWQHSFEEIVGALISAGLRIEKLQEYDRIAWSWFEWMEKDPDGLWRMPEGMGDIPLMFSVTARKEG